MNGNFLIAAIRSSLVPVIGISLSLVLCSAQAATQVVPTIDGQGTVTTDVSPASIRSRAVETRVRHSGHSAGTITTSVSPANAATEIIATPVRHAGGGVITTRTGPTVPPSARTIARAGSLSAPLADAVSLTVSSLCTADAQGTITITDVGADMTVPFSWQLSLNGTPIAENSFQLNAGQSLTIHTSGLFGTLRTDILDPSNTVVASGSMFCPSPPPPVPPSFTLSANCAADATGAVTIADVGGNMTVPFTWRLSQNGTAIASNTFQLNTGQSLTIHTSGLFGTLTLDVLDTSNTVVASAAMFCQSPPPPGPPAFTVSADCTADAQGTITITDVGGNMTVPFSWRLSLNGTPVASNSFQLNAAQSLTIHTSGLFGTLATDVLDPSGAVVASGSTFCPSPPPPVPPSFTLSANCAADATGVMTIADVGGNMTVPFTWRLSQNGAAIASNTFQLNTGQSLTINTSGLFGTLALDVLDASSVVVAGASMFCEGPVSVPNVVGLTQAAATSAITGAGLALGSVTTASSSTVPPGSVISQSPAAGTSVAAGSAVSLVVSSGPLPGDVNGDGDVDCADLAIVKASFGKRTGQTGFDPRADVNHDGVVNIVDLSTVAHAMPAGTVCH